MHASLGDHLTDLVQNAIEAGATRVDVRIIEQAAVLELEVIDNGCGMSEQTLRRALDPASTDGRKHPGRRFGLGLAFLKQMADATGGRLDLASKPGQGTQVRLALDRTHVDLPPQEGLAGALAGLMGFEGAYELTIAHQCDERSYRVSRSELTAALGEIETAMSQALVVDFFTSREESLDVKDGNQ